MKLGTEKLEPKDELFATLDVTAHPAILPSQLGTYFIDTVGFISDIPTELITSFSATLEDASLADLLIHVRDVSHQDHEAQNANVLKTLRNLQMPSELRKTMITVGNKIDLIPESDCELVREDGMIPISCSNGDNMEELIELIDQTLIKSTNRIEATFLVATGSDEYRAIIKEFNIKDIEVDEDDPNCAMIKTIALDYQVNKFKDYLI